MEEVSNRAARNVFDQVRREFRPPSGSAVSDHDEDDELLLELVDTFPEVLELVEIVSKKLKQLFRTLVPS